MGKKINEEQLNEKKILSIFTGFKGGIGKSKIAKHIAPIIFYNKLGITKFNIVEVDDTKTEDFWLPSKNIEFEKFDMKDFRGGIEKLILTAPEKDTLEILDIGGGESKVLKVLNQLKLMNLEEYFDLHFYIPTTNEPTVFPSTKASIETIADMFGCKVNIIYNKVFVNVIDEFSPVFGSEKFGISSKRHEIIDYINKEFVIYNDYMNLIENIIMERKQNGFDFYLECLKFEAEFKEKFFNPETSRETRLLMTKKKTLVNEYLAYCKKNNLIDENLLNNWIESCSDGE